MAKASTALSKALLMFNGSSQWHSACFALDGSKPSGRARRPQCLHTPRFFDPLGLPRFGFSAQIASTAMRIVIVPAARAGTTSSSIIALLLTAVWEVWRLFDGKKQSP
jgi:hypothetical protein